MKLKVRDRVEDRWYPFWGEGVVTAVFKTRVHVRFRDELVRYDYAHARRFLKIS